MSVHYTTLTPVKSTFEQTERRREVQRVTIARGSLENNRSKRFRRLSRALHRFRDLDASTRERTTELLRRLSSQSDAVLNATMSSWLTSTPGVQRMEETEDVTCTDGTYDKTAAELPHDLDNLLSDCFEGTCEDYSWQDEQDALFALAEDTTLDENTPSPPTASLNDIIFPIPEDAKVGSSKTATYPSRDEDVLDSSSPNDAPMDGDVPSILASLYLDYRRSRSNLAALPTPTISPITTPHGTEEDVQVEVIMTKAQLQLTIEEGHFWEGLVADAETPEKSDLTLATLSHSSSMMYDSYQRRTNTPTARNYEECREIIQAMGVPCINSAGVEAEALASSLVLNGLADYVASEDTVRTLLLVYPRLLKYILPYWQDVLVYEAPLIRNLTNRQGPLVVISGADIREVLQLTRGSFVDFALLLGTDFSQRIKNVGPARALRFIKEYGSIERIIEAETKYPLQMPLETYMAQVEIARVVFKTLPPIPEKHVLEGSSPDEADAIVVLQRYGLGREVMASDSWNYSAALDGNYFEDNPHTF